MKQNANYQINAIEPSHLQIIKEYTQAYSQLPVIESFLCGLSVFKTHSKLDASVQRCILVYTLLL